MILQIKLTCKGRLNFFDICIKMEKDGLIAPGREEDRRKVYKILGNGRFFKAELKACVIINVDNK
jgi:hypothetical protein